MTGSAMATEWLCECAWAVVSDCGQEVISGAGVWAMVSGVYEEVREICAACYGACHSGGRPVDLVIVSECESVLGCCCTVFFAAAGFAKAPMKCCVVYAAAAVSASDSEKASGVGEVVGRYSCLCRARRCQRLEVVAVCDSRHRLANVAEVEIWSHAGAVGRSRGRTCPLCLDSDRRARHVLALGCERVLVPALALLLGA